MAQNKLQPGDSVVVKPNVEDHELNINMSGWQGRVAEIEEEDSLIGIDWDSLTLKQLSDKTIVQCEVEGLDWARMYLAPEDVESTTARDSVDDVVKAVEHIESKHDFTWLDEESEESDESDEEDRRIQAILDNAEDESEEAAYEAWLEHLQEVLHFPFEAEVFEWQEEGPLQEGDQVTVVSIYEDEEEYDIFDDDIEDIYGILVLLRHGREKYEFPLCDLEVLDKSSPNYEPVQDYAIWFANR